ncbi:MAG: hypothetical protein LBU81_00765 [Methanosarcinales archaeon]|jgi:hypothetical protein|nr:hypothetical protein [Methanosarcinales archaeon]
MNEKPNNITVEQSLEELEYRANSHFRWDDRLYNFSDDELEKFIEDEETSERGETNDKNDQRP